MTTSKALALPNGGLPTESEFMTLQRLCKAFDASGLYKNIANVAQFIAVVQTGRELGIPPAAALRSFSFIGGKPTASAEMLAALIYRDHGDSALKVVESDSQKCTVEYRRRGWDSPGRLTFTMEDAQQAGLLGDKNANWKKYPRAMLRSRAISEAARTAFQDSILGMRTIEEMAPEQVMVMPDGEMVMELPPTEPEPRATVGEVLDAEESGSAALMSAVELKWHHDAITSYCERDRNALQWIAEKHGSITAVPAADAPGILQGLIARAKRRDEAASLTPFATDAAEVDADVGSRTEELTAYVNDVDAHLQSMKGTRGPMTADQRGTWAALYSRGQALAGPATGEDSRPVTDLKPTELATACSRLAQACLAQLAGSEVTA